MTLLECQVLKKLLDDYLLKWAKSHPSLCFLSGGGDSSFKSDSGQGFQTKSLFQMASDENKPYVWVYSIVSLYFNFKRALDLGLNTLKTSCVV